ncbi:hypothetical protein Tco_0374288 [Tanacetum coccineum]
MNSTVCQSNVSVLKLKTVNVVNDGSNIACVSCGKDVLMLSHDKCVALYALSANSRVIQLVLWIVDSGCSKHMTAINGYGDYVQSNLTICHVYSVKGLGHNLFYVGQFYNGDIEVAFCSNTCYVQNLEGEDSFTGSRDSNLSTISISELAVSSPVCLMSKATSTKS